MSTQFVYHASHNVGKTETDRLIREAVKSIIDLKPRKRGSQPPTLANRPRAKIHAICRKFCIKSGDIHEGIAVASWEEVERQVKQRTGTL